MKYILVASENQIACNALRECFVTGYRIDTVSNKAACLEKFGQRRYDFTFVDLGFLREASPVEDDYDYKVALQPFRAVFPAAEIIVMSPQEMTREAVKAVRAGAPMIILPILST